MIIAFKYQKYPFQNENRRSIIDTFIVIWFQLFFVIFTIEKGNGETLLRKPQPLSISYTFDPSIHSIYDAVEAWCDDPVA